MKTIQTLIEFRWLVDGIVISAFKNHRCTGATVRAHIQKEAPKHTYQLFDSRMILMPSRQLKALVCFLLLVKESKSTKTKELKQKTDLRQSEQNVVGKKWIEEK